MSNSTIFLDSWNNAYEYTTIFLGVLFVASEVLPFLKKHKGNGLMDTMICLLRGSSCLATKLADTIESKEEDVNNNV